MFKSDGTLSRGRQGGAFHSAQTGCWFFILRKIYWLLMPSRSTDVRVSSISSSSPAVVVMPPGEMPLWLVEMVDGSLCWREEHKRWVKVKRNHSYTTTQRGSHQAAVVVVWMWQSSSPSSSSWSSSIVASVSGAEPCLPSFLPSLVLFLLLSAGGLDRGWWMWGEKWRWSAAGNSKELKHLQTFLNIFQEEPWVPHWYMAKYQESIDTLMDGWFQTVPGN